MMSPTERPPRKLGTVLLSAPAFVLSAIMLFLAMFLFTKPLSQAFALCYLAAGLAIGICAFRAWPSRQRRYLWVAYWFTFAGWGLIAFLLTWLALLGDPRLWKNEIWDYPFTTVLREAAHPERWQAAAKQ